MTGSQAVGLTVDEARRLLPELLAAALSDGEGVSDAMRRAGLGDAAQRQGRERLWSWYCETHQEAVRRSRSREPFAPVFTATALRYCRDLAEAAEAVA